MSDELQQAEAISILSTPTGNLSTNSVENDNTIPALSLGVFRATPTGLVIKGDDVDYEVWAAYGNALQMVDHATPWLLGDWLNYGERNYGETYTQAIQVTGLGVQTLTDYKWVAGALPIHRRHPGLTWTHHALVAKLKPNEQESWLKLAEQGNWSTRELTERLRNAGKIEGTTTAATKKANKQAASDADDSEDLLSIITTISAMTTRAFLHYENLTMRDPNVKNSLQRLRVVIDEIMEQLTEPFGDEDEEEEECDPDEEELDEKEAG